MSMVIVSESTMCCMDCGGFHFLVGNNGVSGFVYHPAEKMYQKFDPVTRTHSPCPNSGKKFTFGDRKPALAIEVE